MYANGFEGDIVDLPQGALWSRQAFAGSSVKVLGGGIWLTRQGHFDDQFLFTDERIELPSHAALLIEALTASRLQVYLARRESFFARWFAHSRPRFHLHAVRAAFHAFRRNLVVTRGRLA